MSLFYPLLEITTVSNCVINCEYCPQKAFQRSYRGCNVLAFEDFKRALSTVPKTVEIHFSGFSEPFLNPNCLEMIEYARLEGYKIVVNSTLVGLKTEDVGRLERCKPKLTIHLPDNLGNAKIPITETYKNTLVEVLIKMKVSDFAIMNENFVSNQRAGLCKNSEKIHRTGWYWCIKLVAPQFVMLPNCDVVLCCMDFGLKHKLGNLLEQSYSEIVDSSAFSAIRNNRFHWDGDSLCRNCMWGALRWNFQMYAKNRATKLLDSILGFNNSQHKKA
jgi:sulfatase maturation enzyme AslB (radical SAM superfamily)